VGQLKVIEKTFPEKSVLGFWGVLGIVPFGGAKWTEQKTISLAFNLTH
jgi:hypothetical protein